MLPRQNSCSCPAADVTTIIAREDREGTEVKVNFTYRDCGSYFMLSIYLDWANV